MKVDSTNYRFKFSFVMPVYNVEPYLEEALESIVNQSIGFKENVEIILVNDGSPDNSEVICQKYKDLYPSNIIYIKQQNAGLSAARNAGINKVRGKYVSFMDSDDILSEDALVAVYGFFEKNYDVVDFVSIKQLFFEAKTGEHPLGFKFEHSQVIDIYEKPNFVQLSACSSFVKASVLETHLFDPKIRKFAEDVKFLTELVIVKGRYGVVSGPVYYYRQRSTGTSIIDSSTKDRYWYLGTPKDVYLYLFELSKEKFGRVIDYVQSIVMYDLQWRLRQDSQYVLDKKEQEEYINDLVKLLRDIDDDIILSQQHLKAEYKIEALNLKYDINVLENANKDGQVYRFNGSRIQDYSSSRTKLFVQLFEYKQDKLVIEGLFRGFLCKGVEVGFLVNKIYHKAERDVRPPYEVRFLDRTIFDSNPVKISLSIKVGDVISPVVKLPDGNIIEIGKIEYGHLAGLANWRNAYKVTGGFIFQNIDNRAVEVQQRTSLRVIKRELLLSLYLIRRHRRGRTSVASLPYLLFLRAIAGILKVVKRKDVWIVSDRADSAGDNGEALFKYLSKHPVDHATVYFAISKKSPIYKKMKRYGKVVDRYSLKYKVLFLASDKIISSMADDYVINAFGDDRFFMYDLYQFDFVFLQHGVTKDDISKWLGRYSKNIKLFVAAAKPEYDDLLTKKYGYSEDVVKLTGFPRYDLLENKPEQKVILAPTWRRNLVPEVDKKELKRKRSNEFKETEYFKFYQRIIKSERVNEALKEYGYTAHFAIHPSLNAQADDFEGTDYFTIDTPPHEYKKIFNEGSLLITDYSSVAFDFAYLRKPVVYTQFDRDTFYEGHLYDAGYFSYEKMGFGPVTYSYDDAVNAIVEMIKKRTELTKTYQNRIDKFYAFNDRGNSRRVTEAIIAMDEK
jgi:glycosyltransferase involved in cell wall biosynthesis